MTAIPVVLTRRPPSPPSVDFTALANFTTLGGQLWIVTSPHCNIECDFCHDEGDIPPHITRHDRTAQPRRRELNAERYEAVQCFYDRLSKDDPSAWVLETDHAGPKLLTELILDEATTRMS